MAGGLLLVIFSAVWQFAISDPLTARIPDGWEWRSNVMGRTLPSDETRKEFPTSSALEDPLNLIEWVMKPTSNRSGDGAVTVSDLSTYRDATNNVIVWEGQVDWLVDAKTGEHRTPENAGVHYVFPRHVESSKRYKIRNNTYPTLEFTFQGEETISGLLTYRYTYTGDYVDNSSYPDLKLPTGGEVVCKNYDYNFWVEPVTGEVVRWSDNCPEQWIMNQTTGETFAAFTRWRSDVAADDTIRQVARVSDERTRILFIQRYLPMGLLVIGLALLAAGFLARTRLNRVK
jgi:hypothetical protein